MSNLGDIVFMFSLFIVAIVVISIAIIIFNFRKKIYRRLEKIERIIDSFVSKEKL